MKKYYLHNGKALTGPFTMEELSEKRITAVTPIWFEGLPAWTLAGQVPELRALFTNTVLSFRQDTPPPIARPLRNKTAQRAARARLMRYTMVFLLLMVLLGSVMGGTYQLLHLSKAAEKEEEVQVDFRKDRTEVLNNLAAHITVKRRAYKYSILGGISGLSINICNNTGYVLENVLVQVSYIKANGELWKNEYVNTDSMHAFSAMVCHVPASKRGESVQCKIISVRSAQLGLDGYNWPGLTLPEPVNMVERPATRKK